MVATIPPLLIPKPTASMPLRYGLFQAAIGPLDLPVHGRNGGLRYVTSVCADGFGYEIECVDDQNDKSASWTENGTTTVLGVPFIVYATMQCAPVGYSYEEQRAFVVDRLKSVEQAVVEGILATGAVGQFPSLLAADGIVSVTGGGTTPVEVVSELETALYCGFDGSTIYGQPGVLHMTIPVFNQLKSDHLIEFDGTRWRTPIGTVVSTGCYTGDGVDGTPQADGTSYIYITGQTVIWRTSDAQLEIPPVEGALDRTTNQMMMIAEREYVVTYECGGFAKPVTLWTP